MKTTDLLGFCSEAVTLARSHGADEVEVHAAFGRGANIDLEKNDLQIAGSDEETSYGIRVFKNGAAGFATSNDLSTLKETIQDALVIAASSLADPFQVLPDPRPLGRVENLFDASIGELSVSEITRLGHSLLNWAKSRDSRVSIDSGSVSCGVTRRAIASSRGVAAADESSHLSGSLFGMAVDGSQVSSFVHDGLVTRARAGFEEALRDAAIQFTDKAVGALNPKKGESYKGLVVFTPEAVASVLVQNLLSMMSAGAIRKGKSLLRGRLGETIAAPGFSLFDDGTLPGGVASSTFDREGMPHNPMALVRSGVFANIMFNTYEAQAIGLKNGSTGHASGGPANLPGVGETRLEIPAGTEPLQHILSGLDRAVIVTRFSGSSNSVTGEFSGVVKAGHILRHGERIPVTETLISGNLLDVLKNIVAVSQDRTLLFGRHLFPWIIADQISVTAG